MVEIIEIAEQTENPAPGARTLEEDEPKTRILKAISNGTPKISDSPTPNLANGNGLNCRGNDSKLASSKHPANQMNPQMENDCFCTERGEFFNGSQIRCDQCMLWYHQFCAGITRTQVNILERFEHTMKWFCPRCSYSD